MGTGLETGYGTGIGIAGGGPQDPPPHLESLISGVAINQWRSIESTTIVMKTWLDTGRGRCLFGSNLNE